MGRGRRGKARRWGHDCGTALLWCGGDSIWAVWDVKGLDELVRRRKENRKTTVASGILGAGDPVIWGDLHGRVASGTWTWTRGGADGQRVQ